MWPHSFLISLLLQLSLSLLTRGLSHHYLFPLCWAKTSKLHCFFFFYTRFSTLISGCMLFLLHHSAITLLPYFVYLSVCLLFCFFPFPRFSPALHPWSRARRAAHRHTEPRPNLPLSLSLPVDACLCLGLRLRPAPIVLPHQHIYCTCLLAPCHPHTHSSPSFTERFWQRVKKKIMQT